MSWIKQNRLRRANSNSAVKPEYDVLENRRVLSADGLWSPPTEWTLLDSSSQFESEGRLSSVTKSYDVDGDSVADFRHNAYFQHGESGVMQGLNQEGHFVDGDNNYVSWNSALMDMDGDGTFDSKNHSDFTYDAAWTMQSVNSNYKELQNGSLENVYVSAENYDANGMLQSSTSEQWADGSLVSRQISVYEFDESGSLSLTVVENDELGDGVIDSRQIDTYTYGEADWSILTEVDSNADGTIDESWTSDSSDWNCYYCGTETQRELTPDSDGAPEPRLEIPGSDLNPGLALATTSLAPVPSRMASNELDAPVSMTAPEISVDVAMQQPGPVATGSRLINDRVNAKIDALEPQNSVNDTWFAGFELVDLDGDFSNEITLKKAIKGRR